MKSFKHISVTQVKDLIGAGKVNLVDVRSKNAYDSDHIESASHIDGDNVADFIKGADKQLPLVCYCYHGHSSQSAADYFCQQGFTDVYSMDGGFTQWKETYAK